MRTWKDGLQKEILKNLIDQLDRLEAENERLRFQNNVSGANVSTNDEGVETSLDDEVEKIKNRVFGSDDLGER